MWHARLESACLGAICQLNGTIRAGIGSFSAWFRRCDGAGASNKDASLLKRLLSLAARLRTKEKSAVRGERLPAVLVRT